MPEFPAVLILVLIETLLGYLDSKRIPHEQGCAYHCLGCSPMENPVPYRLDLATEWRLA
jgi:hypothetical protein